MAEALDFLVILSDQPLPWGALAALTEEFSESDLPCNVDILDWATTDPLFRQRIRAAHVIIQQPPED